MVVGTVSALRRGKGVDVLLDAAPAILAAVPQARLVIAGDGPQEAELKAHPSAGLVRWEPYRPPASNHLRELDVYVLASSWEAFPIGPLEALACGVPQVVTAVGGTREAVVPETGLLIPPRDPDALAGAVIELLRDPQRRASHAHRLTRAPRDALHRRPHGRRDRCGLRPRAEPLRSDDRGGAEGLHRLYFNMRRGRR